IEAHREAIIAILTGAQPDADEPQHPEPEPVAAGEPEPLPAPTPEPLPDEQSEPANQGSSQATSIIADEANDTPPPQQPATLPPNLLVGMLSQLDALARDLRSGEEDLRAIHPMTIPKCRTRPDATIPRITLARGECPHGHPVQLRTVRRLKVIDEQATTAR